MAVRVASLALLLIPLLDDRLVSTSDWPKINQAMMQGILGLKTVSEFRVTIRDKVRFEPSARHSA